MQNNKSLTIVLGLVAIVAIGYIAYTHVNPSAFNRDVKCEKCDKGFEATVTPQTSYPTECAICKTKNVYPAVRLQCKKCQIKDIYIVEKESGKAKGTKCGKCGEILMP